LANTITDALTIATNVLKRKYPTQKKLVVTSCHFLFVLDEDLDVAYSMSGVMEELDKLDKEFSEETGSVKREFQFIQLT